MFALNGFFFLNGDFIVFREHGEFLVQKSSFLVHTPLFENYWHPHMGYLFGNPLQDVRNLLPE